jgi:hypothetical protein
VLFKHHRKRCLGARLSETFYLLYAYPKNEQEDLTAA